MAINWFPGHMHKARKQIAQLMPKVDVVIEVLDARLPYSSQNPMIEKLRHDTPAIKILNKADLADPEVTDVWLNHFKSLEKTTAIALSQDKPGIAKQLPALCRQMTAHKSVETRVSAMIMGIPNVGKSTLINTLMGRQLAKTGNEPAVTKGQQRLVLNDMILTDTPGMLWPKIEDLASGLRLATSGAVRDTAMEYEEVGEFAAAYILQTYPSLIQKRFKIDELPETGLQLLEIVGSKRGCLRKGKPMDMHRASVIFLHELRAGTIGRISLETPEDIPKPLTSEENSSL